MEAKEQERKEEQERIEEREHMNAIASNIIKTFKSVRRLQKEVDWMGADPIDDGIILSWGNYFVWDYEQQQYMHVFPERRLINRVRRIFNAV